MNRIVWLRIIGACVAVLLLLHAAIGFYGDLVQPAFRASDLFSGKAPPDKASLVSSQFLASLSFDGDLLANTAAAKAADVLHRPAPDASARAGENKSTQDAIVSALKLSPIRPALWLTLGMLKAQSGEPVTPAVKMSYFTGNVPIDVAVSRIQTVISSAAATDDDIKLLAQSDIRSALANRSRYEPVLIAAYTQATPQGKALLREAAQAADPKFGDVLKRY